MRQKRDRELPALRRDASGGEIRQALDQWLQKRYWRSATCIKICERPIWIWRNRLRAAFWRLARRVPPIDRWATGRFMCRR